jgi:hypothetical protein
VRGDTVLQVGDEVLTLAPDDGIAGSLFRAP